jgi:mxaC protein
MTLALANPEVLYLLPIALLPLLAGVLARQGYPSLAGVGHDKVSSLTDAGLKAVGVAAILSTILAVGGLHRRGDVIERTGEGAHIVLLIDRSASMDNSFAGRPPSGEEQSKSGAARRLLKDFIRERAHDFVGVAAFSTAPMHVLPLTDHKDAVMAAVDAMDRPGLAFTNVGRGLALALDMHETSPPTASRAILLVSDGAAVIDRKVQEKIRAAFAKRPINLYWLFLRTEGSKGIYDVPGPDEPDTPQALPERHLDKFFKSLKIPYRSFEAENPQAVAEAIAEIGRLEKKPITYLERVPQKDLSPFAYAAALFCVLLLLVAKAIEVPLVPDSGRRT